jgi:hypothetical protein
VGDVIGIFVVFHTNDAYANAPKIPWDIVHGGATKSRVIACRTARSMKICRVFHTKMRARAIPKGVRVLQ